MLALCVQIPQVCVELQLSPMHFEYWAGLVASSKMATRQEFIHFYDGETNAHPKLPRVFVRDGFGEQRWADSSLGSTQEVQV